MGWALSGSIDVPFGLGPLTNDTLFMGDIPVDIEQLAELPAVVDDARPGSDPEESDTESGYECDE